MQITEKIRVEMAGNPLYYIHVPTKQGDVKTRYIDVELVWNGEPFVIPEGASVRAAFKKPDGFDVLNDCIVADNVVTIELTDQVRAVPGKALCELMVQHEGKMITSSSFVVTVYPGLLQDGKPESSDEYKSFINALLALDTVSDIAKQALENALAAQAELDRLTSGAEEAAERSEAAAIRSETAADDSEIAKNKALEHEQGANNAKVGADQSKAASEISALDSQQYAVTAGEQMLLAKYYAEQAQSVVSNMPMRYYRLNEDDMQAIVNPHQGDPCYVTDYTVGTTQLYVYDTVDMDDDGVNPEWVFLGNLDFASLDRPTLLGILQLAPIALSGDYGDLRNLPPWYRAPVTLDGTADTVAWDYSQSDRAIVTLIEDKSINITGLFPGCEGVLQVYGTGSIILPEDQQNPLISMVPPLDGEHATYTFYSRDGVAIDWHMMPSKGATP